MQIVTITADHSHVIPRFHDQAFNLKCPVTTAKQVLQMYSSMFMALLEEKLQRSLNTQTDKSLTVLT